MFALLALIFVIVPFAELIVLLQIGSLIGALPTLALLVVVSIVGALLVKREGLGVIRRAQAAVRAGAVPASELVDGALILFAGALLLTPGFLTDILGTLLLVPPIRSAVRAAAAHRLARRAALGLERW